MIDDAPQAPSREPETGLEFLIRVAHRGLEEEILDSASTLRVTGDLPGFVDACNRALSRFDEGLGHINPAGGGSLRSAYGRLAASNLAR